MQPVLIVDGQEYKVREINYNDNGEVSYVGIFRESGVYTHYFDNAAECYIEKALRVNMKDSLKWMDRYKEVLKDLEQVIDEKAELMTTLAHEEMYRKRDLPFSDNKKEREYFEKERELIGLLHAQEIIENLID